MMCECQIAELKRAVTALTADKADLLSRLIGKQVELNRAKEDIERLKDEIRKFAATNASQIDQIRQLEYQVQLYKESEASNEDN